MAALSAKEETDVPLSKDKNLLAPSLIPQKYYSKSYTNAFMKQLKNIRKTDILCDVQIITPRDNHSINVYTFVEPNYV